MIMQDPVKELDEFYCKDDKVPEVDLERIVSERLKEEEEEKFQLQLA